MTAQWTPEWLDAQYDNGRRVPDHPRIFERWREASALSRAQSDCRIDVAYGEGALQTLDLFLPAQRGAPVFFFIHGGYWRSFDKAANSFVAPSFVADGALVVLPNYPLCPQVKIEDIALAVAQAMAWTVRHASSYGGDPDRLVVAGHSAGGHLAAMLLACDWSAIDDGIAAGRVRRALSVSGLFDLEPLRHTPYLQRDLHLDAAGVARLSPARWPAPAAAVLHAVVGGDESEEFLRQNNLIRQAWGEGVVPVCETVPGANHFDILTHLADPASRLHGLALSLLCDG